MSIDRKKDNSTDIPDDGISVDDILDDSISIDDILDDDVPGDETKPHGVSQPRSAYQNRKVLREFSKESGRRKAAEKNKTSGRRRLGFYKALLLCVAVFMAAICVGAYFFWGFIKAYEDSRLEHIVLFLEENIDFEFWEKSAESEIGSRLTEFERGGEIPVKQHLPMIRDLHYSLRQNNDESTPETPVYTIRAGARDIGVVRFIPVESVGYGYSKWGIGNIEFLSSFVDAFSRDVSITASQNAHVELNGVTVPQEHRTHCDYEHGATYLIQGIYGDVTVSVVEIDGEESSPFYVENSDYHFPIRIPFSRSYVITAPDTISVLVDGEQVSQSTIADSFIPSIFDGVLDVTNAPVLLNRYEFELDGLYIEPILTAVDGQGRVLQPQPSGNGEISFSEEFSEEYKTLHEGTVEDFIRAYVSFGSNVGNSVEANFARLSRLMLGNTELYRRVANTRNAMIWVSGTTVRYNELRTSNFLPYGDSHFSCEVYYNITHNTRYEARELEGHFEVLFVLSGGRWLAAKMVAM